MLEAYVLYAALFLFPALFVPPHKRRTLSGFLSALSLSVKPARVTLLYAFIGLTGLLIAAFLGALLVGLFGFSDGHHVTEKIAALNVLGILLVVSLGPLSEETFFRGFLQPRLGLVFTSVVFAVLHYAFFSIFVVVVAFFSALVLGHLFNRTHNLWACVLAHAAFNAIGVISAHTLGL